jgi:hypothetical protein
MTNLVSGKNASYARNHWGSERFKGQKAKVCTLLISLNNFWELPRVATRGKIGKPAPSVRWLSTVNLTRLAASAGDGRARVLRRCCGGKTSVFARALPVDRRGRFCSENAVGVGCSRTCAAETGRRICFCSMGRSRLSCFSSQRSLDRGHRQKISISEERSLPVPPRRGHNTSCHDSYDCSD